MANKNILIFGKNSYIGTSFKNHISGLKGYNVDVLDSMDENWKNENFSKYDTIYHVAGIAHVSSDPKMEQLYYNVNRDLPVEVAKKAKKENVRQFIFMSSMIIYGDDLPIKDKKVIDCNTIPSPSNFYGDSKLQADIELQKLQDDNFNIVIIRPPMVYGPNCKGNFVKLKKIAKYSPIFPNIENQRSMIYIDNLCEFVKQVIDGESYGIFYPQNSEYISTKAIIKILSEKYNRKIYFIKLFNPIIKLLSKKVNIINKVFGNKIYSKEISGNFSYCIVSTEESIRRCIE